MESKSTKSIEVTIIMDEIEARWLMGIMQNPIYGQQPDDENQTDRTMRKIFWDVLQREGIEL